MHGFDPLQSFEHGAVAPVTSLASSLRLWASIDPSRCAISVRHSGDGAVTNISYAALDQYSDSVAAALRDMTPDDSVISLDHLSEMNAIHAVLGAMKAHRRPVFNAGEAAAAGTLQKAPCFAIVESGHASAPETENGSAITRFAMDDLLLRLDHPLPEATEANGVAHYQLDDRDQSTSRLLGVEHAELNRWLDYTGARHGQSFRGRSFFAAPVSHCIGLYYGLFMPVFHGGQAVRLASQDVYASDGAIARALVEARPTIAGGPTMRMTEAIRKLAGDSDANRDRQVGILGSLRTLLLCGEEASREDLDDLTANLARFSFDGAVRNLYVSAASPAGAHEFGHRGTPDADAPPATGRIVEGELYLPRDLIARAAHPAIPADALHDHDAPGASYLPVRRCMGANPSDTAVEPVSNARSEALDRIWSVVKSVIVEILGEVQPADIKETTRLVDLGANSIDRTEIVIDSMGQLGLRVPQTQFAGVKNIGEVVNILADHMLQHTDLQPAS